MKGKFKFTRLFCLIAALCLMSGVCTVVSFAAEGEELTDTAAKDNTLKTEEGAEAAPELSESNEDTQNEATSNVFALIYEGFEAHIGEILSALTLAGTVIVGYAYKKGLLPLVTSAVSAMQTTVGNIKKKQEEDAEDAKSGISTIADKLAAVENSLSIFTDTLSTLEEKLEDRAEAISEREKIRTVMNSQIDMLYDIFMSSAIPQYQKEAVGTRVQRMKEELMVNEKAAE